MATLKLPPKAEPVAENTDRQMLAATPELNPRAQILREIAERSNAQADADAAETIPGMEGDELSNEVAEPQEPVAEIQAEPEVEQTPPAPAVAPQFDPDIEYELIVFGKPMKVKGSQIIEQGKAAIQKETAADIKLEKATRMLEEVRAMANPPKPAAEVLPDLTDEQLAQIIEVGTPEEKAFAIKILRGDVQSSRLKIQEMEQSLPKVVSDQLAFHEAATFVQTEYKDLLEDPYLRQIFFIRENELRQTGDTRPYKDLYKVIGDDLRKHFNRPAATPTKTMEEKREAKANAPAVPRLASARMEAAAEKKPPTREEILFKMQQARGQRPAAIN